MVMVRYEYPKNLDRIKLYFDPLPIWYPPFEDVVEGVDQYPMHAITQRPMAMCHSWGSQNAWLRQIHGENRLYIAREKAKSMDLADDDLGLGQQSQWPD